MTDNTDLDFVNESTGETIEALFSIEVYPHLMSQLTNDTGYIAQSNVLAGTNVTITRDTTAGTITINSTAQSGSDVDAKIATHNTSNQAHADIRSALSTESTTRASADTTLQANINAEATARGSADTTLQTNINREASTRSSKDTELSNRITANTNKFNDYRTASAQDTIDAGKVPTYRKVNGKALTQNIELTASDVHALPDTTVVPTKVSQLENDSQYQTIDSINSAIATHNTSAIAHMDLRNTLNNHVANKGNPHEVTKSQVGLGNVDNTSDINKPVSTATQTALNAKQDTLVSGTNIKTINGTPVIGSGNISIREGVTDYDNLTDKPKINGVTLQGDKTATQLGFKTVATSGSYNDLSDKPTIPTKVGQLQNDIGFVTRGVFDLQYYTTTTALTSLLNAKQDTLVSGTNIKTINSQSLLGSGNIVIQGGGGGTVGDGRITIQKNSTDIGTFTVNQSSNTTIDIPVPTVISDLTDDTETTPIAKANTLTGLTATIGELNYTDGVTSNIQTQLNGKQATISDLDTIRAGATAGATALQDSDVINTLDSTETKAPLSANMGKSLQDQVNHLKSIGRFLSLWNCATGLAQTNPTTSPYTYKTGDYFIVGTISTASPAVNYKPDGTTYVIGTASTVTESDTVDVGYIYWFDGTTWNLMQAEAGTVTDVLVNNTSVVTNGVASIPYNQTINITYSDSTTATLTMNGSLA